MNTFHCPRRALLHFTSVYDFLLPKMPVSHSSPALTSLLHALSRNSSDPTRTQHQPIIKPASFPESGSRLVTFPPPVLWIPVPPLFSAISRLRLSSSLLHHKFLPLLYQLWSWYLSSFIKTMS